MALVTVEELAAKMRATLDEASAAQAVAAACATAQTLTGQTLESADHSEMVEVEIVIRPPIMSRGQGNFDCFGRYVGRVSLGQRPVTAVDSVVGDGLAVVEPSWWWDGRAPYVWLADPGIRMAEVGYTAGYDPVPADLKAVVLALAAEEYATPSPVVASERLGDYQVTYKADAALSKRMSDVLRRYGRAVSSVRTGG